MAALWAYSWEWEGYGAYYNNLACCCTQINNIMYALKTLYEERSISSRTVLLSKHTVTC